MTKREIIKQVHAYLPGEHDIRQIDMYFDAIFKVMGNALKEKKHIELRGFGSFTPVKKKARQTVWGGKYTTVKERHVVKFKPGKLLQAQLVAK